MRPNISQSGHNAVHCAIQDSVSFIFPATFFFHLVWSFATWTVVTKWDAGCSDFWHAYRFCWWQDPKCDSVDGSCTMWNGCEAAKVKE